MSAPSDSREHSGVELAMPRLLLDDGTIVACLRRFDRSRLVIGSSPSADLYLAGDPSIAAEHACIVWDDTLQSHVLHDCGTAVSTLLDGGRLRRSTPLVNGARIRIGSTDLVYCRRVPMHGYVSTLTRRVRPSLRLLAPSHRVHG